MIRQNSFRKHLKFEEQNTCVLVFISKCYELVNWKSESSENSYRLIGLIARRFTVRLLACVAGVQRGGRGDSDHAGYTSFSGAVPEFLICLWVNLKRAGCADVFRRRGVSLRLFQWLTGWFRWQMDAVFVGFVWLLVILCHRLCKLSKSDFPKREVRTTAYWNGSKFYRVILVAFTIKILFFRKIYVFYGNELLGSR